MRSDLHIAYPYVSNTLYIAKEHFERLNFLDFIIAQWFESRREKSGLRYFRPGLWHKPTCTATEAG